MLNIRPRTHVYVTPPNTSIGVCHDRIDDHTEGIHMRNRQTLKLRKLLFENITNVNGDEKKNSFDSKGKSRKYDVETLQQNKYISIEIPEPSNLFDLQRTAFKYQSTVSLV